MSAPQPPEDDGPTRPAPGSGDDTGTSRTFEFHGEQLDFDPYRFGAPETPPPAWSPTPPRGDDSPRPPQPGERWNPAAGADAPPEVHPGDYWQGAGSQGGQPGSGEGAGGQGAGGQGAGPSAGPVFPPPGYTPPPVGGSDPAPRVGLDKAPTAPPQYGYPPAGYPQQGGHQQPGYPPRPGAPQRRGNGLAVWGFVLGVLGVLLALTSWPGIVLGLVGLGLAIAGYVQGRRGARLKTLALWGIALSVVAVVAGSIVLVFYLQRIDFDCIQRAGDDFSSAQDCVR